MASKKELRALITLAGKIDPSLQTALMKASKESLRMSQNMQKSGAGMAKIGNLVKGVLIGTLGARAISSLGSAMLEAGRNGLQLASDLTEVQNVVDKTFGDSAGSINRWSKNALMNYGLAELSAKKYSSTLGAMLKSSGLSEKNTLEMSQALTGLAGDFASFYNLAQDDAFDKIRAGIAGETEPLRQLGINMTVANLEAYALSKGIKTSYEKMDQASQVALRYSYLMEKSKDAQGDFAQTQGSYANQQRLLTTNLNQLSSTIMSKVLPILTKYVQKGNEWIRSIANSPDKLEMIQNGVVKAANTIVGLGEAALRTAGFIRDNWWIIEPMIWGITGAMVAWNVATKAGMVIHALTKAWQIGSAVMMMFQSGASLATVAQWALNAAMTANPIGLIIVGIGALIAGIVLLYKNWDKVMSFFGWAANGAAEGIKIAFGGVGKFFGFVFENTFGLIKGYFGLYARIANFVISGLNKVQFNVPDWVPLIGGKHVGINIPLIPTFANGGFANQPSIFGEAGPEAAIPLKRTPRSLGLLERTARILGVGGGGLQLTYAPVIYGSNRAELEPILQQHKEDIREMVESLLSGNRRDAYGY